MAGMPTELRPSSRWEKRSSNTSERTPCLQESSVFLFHSVSTYFVFITCTKLEKMKTYLNTSRVRVICFFPPGLLLDIEHKTITHTMQLWFEGQCLVRGQADSSQLQA